jgi:hypothetical protein
VVVSADDLLNRRSDKKMQHCMKLFDFNKINSVYNVASVLLYLTHCTSKPKFMSVRLLLALGLIACTAGAAAQTSTYVAGLHPDRRPDAAPQLTDTVRTPDQLARALHGIDPPVPGNVESIAATGNEWVPLRHPGMTWPYDLRGWHDAPANPPSTVAPVTR